MRILLIEDDKKMAQTIKRSLEDLYIIDVSYSGVDGEYLAYVNEYDLIIIDLILPDMHGDEVCKKIRKNCVKTPILFLTARDSTKEIVRCFDSGGDDYVTKPYDLDELLARIRALMRRSHNKFSGDLIQIGDLCMDVAKRKVLRSDKEIHLRKKEYELLEYLMRNPKRVLTRSMILEHVWENGIDEFSNTIDVHIKHLRDKVDRPYKRNLIHTIHGLGYKIE